MEAEQRPLEEVLFGSGSSDVFVPGVDLAETISAWFRASRSKLREGDSAGRPNGDRHEGNAARSRWALGRRRSGETGTQEER